MSNPTTQLIDVSAAGQDFSFNVTREAYNKYVNAVTPTNKIAPSHNFLVGTVAQEQRDALVKLIRDTPGAEVQLAGAVLEEYTPDLGIVAKKRSA
ncbi:putative phage tail assembly chaperone [Hahella sp. CR1]|uniref:putative phage tail assembly chaperone n=1 Tax=Hahella sp. CR1 TaxID=2992807 RepID=UPI0024426BAF|nr:putative phage tail assembly chaperone [Hahella sp. CR1]MDG9666726.1 putative phage tail assembly chaperone [Hahella sp. CR1]